MTPRVSVVIPSFNNADFIGETVNSILGQSFTDFELLVSDHSSTDGTWEILQQFTTDPRVRLSRIPQGGGAPANWNAVTELASGEFIKLVCGDDVLFPDMLAKQVAALASHPSAVMASSSRTVVDATGRIVMRNRGLCSSETECSGPHAIRRTVRAGTNIFGEPASVLLRRSRLSDIGGWDGRFPYLLDQATYCTALLGGDLVTVPGPLSAFRLSRCQWSVALIREQSNQAAGYFRDLALNNPGLLSQNDVAVGCARAHFNAHGRRIVYRWLGARLSVDHVPRTNLKRRATIGSA